MEFPATDDIDVRSAEDRKRRRALEARNAKGLALLRSRTFDGLPIDGDPPETRTPVSLLSSVLPKALRAMEESEGKSFADRVAAEWKNLFPDCAARPSRYVSGMLFLKVKSSAALYAVRPRLPAMRRALSSIPGAPKGLSVKLEIGA